MSAYLLGPGFFIAGLYLFKKICRGAEWSPFVCHGVSVIVVVLLAMESVIELGLVFLLLGLFVQLVIKRGWLHGVGQALIGFGVMAIGLLYLIQIFEPFRMASLLESLLDYVHANPLTTMVAAAAITALLRTTIFVLGLGLAMAMAGVLSFTAAMPVILGVNFGIGIPIVWQLFREPSTGRVLTMSSLMAVQLGLASLLFLFLSPVIRFFHYLGSAVLVFVLHVPVTVEGELAMAHIFFNLLGLMVVAPSFALARSLICRLNP